MEYIRLSSKNQAKIPQPNFQLSWKVEPYILLLKRLLNFQTQKVTVWNAI